jgi:hypothetical protein
MPNILISHQSVSEKFPGLEIVIDHQTGAVRLTRDNLAKLVGVQPQVIDDFEKRLIKSGKLVDCFFDRVIYPESDSDKPKKVKLYGDDFIFDLMYKFNRKLVREIMTPGLRVFSYELIGFGISANAIKKLCRIPDNISELISLDYYFMSDRKFVECCIKNGYDVAEVSSYLAEKLGIYDY